MKTKKQKTYLLLLLLIALTILISSIFLLFPENIQQIKTQLFQKYYGAGECVGYVERYYQNEFNIEIKNVGVAQNLFGMAAQFGLFPHKNNGTIYPQPGDILVYSHKNQIGHVAIITDVAIDNIKIIEQNWISENTISRHTLPASYDGINYKLFERNRYKPLGWVSRTASNPSFGNTFFFYNGRSQGWIAENDARQISENKNFWQIKITGRRPMVLSPVFLKESPFFDGTNEVRFKAKILNSNRATYQGKVFLRNEKGEWETEIPFEFKNNGKIQSISINNLRPNFKTTQVRIQLNSTPLINSEIWSFDWIYIK